MFYVGAEPLKDLDLQAVPAASLAGTFQFDGTSKPPEPEQLPSVYLGQEGVAESIRNGLSRRRPSADQAGFRIDGIVGANIVNVRPPEGWIAEGVVLPDGRDILDKNFEFEPGTHYDGVRVILSDRSRPFAARCRQGIASILTHCGSSLFLKTKLSEGSNVM